MSVRVFALLIGLSWALVLPAADPPQSDPPPAARDIRPATDPYDRPERFRPVTSADLARWFGEVDPDDADLPPQVVKRRWLTGCPRGYIDHPSDPALCVTPALSERLLSRARRR